MQKYKRYIFLGLIIAIMVAYFPMSSISPILIIFLGLFLGSFLATYNQRNSEDSIFLLNIFVLAFLSRIIVAFLLYNFIFLSEGRGLLHDSWPYSENGYTILQMWLNGIRDVNYIANHVRINISISRTVGAYDFWNAIVYFFTGKSPLSLIFINCLAGSLTVLFIYDITKKLSNKRAAVFASFLTAFWPSTFLWSIQNLKEPIIVFLVCFLMWTILQVRRRFRFYLVFLTIVLAAALKEFRGFIFFVFLFILPLSLFFTAHIRKEVRLFLIISVCLIIFLFIEQFKSFFPFLSANEVPLEWLYRMRSYRAYGGSAFLTGWDFTSIPKFIVFLPIAFLVSWLAPFPWQLGSLRQIAAVPEMVLFYLLIPCMVYGIRFILKDKFKEGILIILYISIVGLILAAIEGNVGTLFRHRAMMLPFCFILIAIGLDRYNFRITARTEIK